MRVLIVDDGALARKRLRDLLLPESDVHIVSECANGIEAVEALEKGGVDLVFLDVQMPELDGFGVIETVGAARMPPTIFVTAFDQHAVQAFEVRALDYLLKPFSAARFKDALQHARDRMRQAQQGSLHQQLEGLIEGLKGPKYLERLLIKGPHHMFFLAVMDITHLEAADNYVKVHAGGSEHLVRQTLSSLEAQMDSTIFVRIHRSCIVNLRCVDKLQPWFHGDVVVVLKDGTKLAMSRNFRKNFPELG